jgi:4-carboxymuconolactone decarboxylase
MDDSERRDAGLRVRRAVLGDAHVDRALAATTPSTQDFQDLITRYAWGEIWTRPGLDQRTRRLLVIGTLLAQGHWDELRMHVRAALMPDAAGALSRDEVREVLLQQAVYCGVPAVNHAFALLAPDLDAPASPVP